MKASLSYCGQQVYAQDRNRFLQCLFIPSQHREAFLCLFALNLELAHIPRVVSEEMIGHIRYAWWQESIEGIYAGKAIGGQPVLQALASAGIAQPVVMALVEAYRASYPRMPAGIDEKLEEMSQAMMQALCPQSKAAWDKAGSIIRRHLARHGKRRNSWLLVKLLAATFTV